MRRLAVVALALLLAACGGSDSLFADQGNSTPADYVFVIERGTGDQIDAGEPVSILPAELEVHVGEIIEIVNHDDRGHLVGPFFVGAGETVRQRFASPGTFIGECTVHPSGQIELVVTES